MDNAEFYGPMRYPGEGKASVKMQGCCSLALVNVMLWLWGFRETAVEPPGHFVAIFFPLVASCFSQLSCFHAPFCVSFMLHRRGVESHNIPILQSTSKRSSTNDIMRHYLGGKLEVRCMDETRMHTMMCSLYKGCNSTFKFSVEVATSTVDPDGSSHDLISDLAGMHAL